MIIKATNKNLNSVINSVIPVKRLADLTHDELMKLYDGHKEIQEACFERLRMDTDYQEEELFSFLGAVKGLDFNLGYPGNYICFSAYSRDAYDEFFEACIDVQKEYCLFPDDVYEKIKRAATKADFYRECCNGYEDISEARFEHLEKYMKTVFCEAKNSIIRAYNDMEDYCYSETGAREEAELWADDHNSDYYTDGINLYEY